MFGARRRAIYSDTRNLESRLKSLRGSIGALQDDVAGLMGDVGDYAGSQMRGAVKSAHLAVDRAETWGNDNLHDVRELVREQPLKAFAIAAGIGVLASFILFRR